jgi:hypothetical protein
VCPAPSPALPSRTAPVSAQVLLSGRVLTYMSTFQSTTEAAQFDSLNWGLIANKICHIIIDISHHISYVPQRSLTSGRIRMRSDIRSECGACGRICTPLPGGFGHRPDRHYDRSARCLAKLGGGEGPRSARTEVTIRQRVKRGPRLSGGVRSPKREPPWSAERRACSAEHAAASAQMGLRRLRRLVCDAAIGWMRLSALRFPSFVRGTLLQWRHAGSGADARRERACSPSCPAIAGKGDHAKHGGRGV